MERLERRVIARRRSVSTPAEIIDRIAEIDSVLPNMAIRLRGWIPKRDESERYYYLWETSNYAPNIYNAGGLGDQPKWLFDDFEGIAGMMEIQELIKEKERLTKQLAESLK